MHVSNELKKERHPNNQQSCSFENIKNTTQTKTNLHRQKSSSCTSIPNEEERTRINIIGHCEDLFLMKVKNCSVSKFPVSVCFETVNIWTISTSPLNEIEQMKRPMVFFHGLCGGSALWVKMMDLVSNDRICYFIDLPGFAKSSRVEFGSDALVNVMAMIELLEQWRIKIGLNESFDLFGHSFGAYIACCYCLRHKELVKNLILLDPWGISSLQKGWNNTPEIKANTEVSPKIYKGLSFALKLFNPLTFLRLGGLAGKFIMSKIRDDLWIDFTDVVKKETFFDYLYYCNAGEPTGEKLYSSLQDDVYLSKFPISSMAENFSKDLNLSILSASESVDYFINQKMGTQLKETMGEHRVNHLVFENQNHHLYANNEFLLNLKDFLKNLT